MSARLRPLRTAGRPFSMYFRVTMLCCWSSARGWAHGIALAPSIRPIKSPPPRAAPWALMIDATARTDARAQAARVKQQFPQAPLLVICADGAAADWAESLGTRRAGGRGRTRSDCFPKFLRPPLKSLTASWWPRLELMPPTAAASLASIQRRSALWVVGLSLVLAASGTWYLISKSAGPPATSARTTRTAPSPVVPPAVQAPVPVVPVAPVPTRTVLELLSDARVAFREGKSLLPSTEGASNGNSALELYAKVLAQDPQNEEARDGLRRLFAVSSARIRANLNAGKEDDAARLLNAFRGVGIDPAAIAKLEAEIVAARPRMLITQTRAALAKGDTDSAVTLTGATGRHGRGPRDHRRATDVVGLSASGGATRRTRQSRALLDQVGCPAGSRK